MLRDVYLDYVGNYLKNVEKSEVDNQKKTNNDFPLLKNNDEYLKILKEISKKLDKGFQKSDNNESENFNMSLDNSIDLAIINGNVVIPDECVVKTNIYIKNGKIIAIGNFDFLNAKDTLDATDKYVIPGIFDPHVHLGIFSPFEKEIITETKAALAGGVTTIGCYFNSAGSYFDILPKAMDNIEKNSYVDVVPHLILNSELHRREIRDYINILGVTSFKVYLSGIPELIPDIEDDYIMSVLEELKKSDKKCILCSHAENKHIVKGATKRIMQDKGDLANIIDWADTHPDIAEEEACIRMAYWAKKAGVSVYLVHVSAALTINSLRKIKKENPYIKIETTSPYLSINKHTSKDYLNKMVPPFRSHNDIDELWKAVEDGTIDTIGTDNVSITKEEKKINGTIWDVVPGYPALETHLPILLNEGVIKRGLPIEKVITNITKRPAQIFNVYPRKGTLQVGSDADIVIVDLNLKKKIIGENLVSRSDFSPFENQEIQGWPIVTVKSGQVVIRDGQLVGIEKKGSCIIR